MNAPPDTRGSARLPRLDRWQRLALLLVLLVPSVLRLQGIDDNLLGPSEWREVETATLARHFLEEPDILRPRVNWGAPGPGYVEAEFQLFSWSVHLLYRVFGPEPWLGRAFAVALAALATWLMFRLARRLLPAWPALLAAFSFTSTPLLFRYGRSFMPEAMALVFYVLAAERLLAWLQTRGWREILTAGACLSLAILVKPTGVHLGLVAAILAWRAGSLRLVFGRQMLAFGLIALLPAALYYFHAAALHHEYGNTFGVISGGDSKWGNLSWWLDPEFYRTLQFIDVVYGMGYTGSLLALLAMLVGEPRVVRSLTFAWLLVIFVYYLIVARYAGHESRGLQYHVYVIAPLAIATAAGAAAVWRLVRRQWPRRPWLTWLIVALPVLGMTTQQWRSNLRFLRATHEDVFLRAGQALAEVSAPDDHVLVTSTDRAVDDGVANNFEEPKVMFHAWRRGRILPRDRLSLQNLLRAQRECDARWLVVMDAVLPGATADFRAAIGRLQVAAQGEGFRILDLSRD